MRLQLFDRGKAALHEIAQRHEPGADAILGDGKDRTLGLVEQQVRLLLGFVGVGEDLVRRVNQVAERRLLFDDARVVLDVGGARHAVGQRGDVGGAADFVELTAARQLLAQRHEIDGLAALAERDHAVEDAPVRVAKEVAPVDVLGGLVEGVVVDQDGAEDGFLGVETVRERTFGGDVRHRSNRLKNSRSRAKRSTESRSVDRPICVRPKSMR